MNNGRKRINSISFKQNNGGGGGEGGEVNLRQRKGRWVSVENTVGWVSSIGGGFSESLPKRL